LCLRSHTAPAPSLMYTLSLHDALPISTGRGQAPRWTKPSPCTSRLRRSSRKVRKNQHLLPKPICGLRKSSPVQKPKTNVVLPERSEEHTSELQLLRHLVCRLLLEKKNK